MKNAARLLVCFACVLLCGCAAVSFDGAVKRGVLSSESELKSIEIVRQGSPITARRHLSLEQGDRVSTDSESTAIIRYANGTVVYVRPNSVVRIGSIFVEIGEIFVRAKGFFRVDTEFVTAGVEGTEYVVRVGPQQQTGVIVLEGRVGCESKLQRWPKFSLGPLEKARFEREGPPDRSRAGEAEIQEIRRWVNEIDRILPPPIPQFELPKRGYCCTDKSLFPNETAVSCQRESGRFYDDFEVARRECSRVSPAAGFCCVDARLSESSEQYCQNRRGRYFNSYDAGRNYCQPPDPVGYCCASGKVSPSSQKDCAANKGSFSFDRASLEKQCSKPYQDPRIKDKIYVPPPGPVIK
jgi:hypothetical protein